MYSLIFRGRRGQIRKEHTTILSLMALKICRAGCENGLLVHRKEEHMDLNDLKIYPEFEEKIPH